jgi:hypothetical protein
MQITLDTNAVVGVVSFVAGVAGALGVAWTRVVRPIQRIAEDWRGEPARPNDGLPERPGMMLRMARLEAEMHPNHGSSLRDAVNRLEANMAAHIASHAVSLVPPLPPASPFGSDDGTHGGQRVS